MVVQGKQCGRGHGRDRSVGEGRRGYLILPTLTAFISAYVFGSIILHHIFFIQNEDNGNVIKVPKHRAPVVRKPNDPPSPMWFDWESAVLASVPNKSALLVHAPFFWKQLLENVADVRIGNFNRDRNAPRKGYGKVSNRSELWRPVADWLAIRSNRGKVPIIFAKCSLCTLLSADRSYIHSRFVLMGTFNDNWGMLANNRGDRIHQHQMLSMMLDPRCGRSLEDLESFVTDERLVLWAVNHHVYRSGLKKVITLPLGVKDAAVWDDIMLPLQQKSQGNVDLTMREIDRLLELNNNEWRARAATNRAINESFLGTLTNAYDKRYKGTGKSSLKDQSPPVAVANAREIAAMRRQYLTRLRHSAFVLCPPGLGMDSYRVYEALLAGAIPIVESSPGLHEALHGLPVLIVDDLAERVTPHLLEHVYTFVGTYRNRQSQWPWRFEKLTTKYWIQLIHFTASNAAGVSSREVNRVKAKATEISGRNGVEASGTSGQLILEDTPDFMKVNGTANAECLCFFPPERCVMISSCRQQ